MQHFLINFCFNFKECKIINFSLINDYEIHSIRMLYIVNRRVNYTVNPEYKISHSNILFI